MNSFDAVWEQIHREIEWGRYPSEEIVRFVARNFYKRDRSAVRILDAGCGGGAATWYLAREGFAAYAFDGSEAAVSKARKRIQNEGLKADITVGDAANMSYASGFFECIIDSAMVSANTLENIKRILKECHRVLKINGKFFSTGLFKIGMTGYATGEKVEENTYRCIRQGPLAHRGTIHFFDRNQIISLWTEAGFKKIVIDSVDRTDRGGAQRVSYYMVEAKK